MKNTLHARSYEFLRDKFLQLAEDLQIPISPTVGRSKAAQIGSVIYYEWYYDRQFQVTLHPEAPIEFDYAYGGFPYKGEEVPSLGIFVRDVTKTPDLLWKIRCMWFDFSRPVEEILEDVQEVLPGLRRIR
jgi:hypothetical protein